MHWGAGLFGLVVAATIVSCAAHDDAASASHPPKRAHHRKTMTASAGGQRPEPVASAPAPAPAGLASAEATTRAQSVVWDHLSSARVCYARMQRKAPGDPGGSVVCSVSFQAGDATNYVTCEGSARTEIRECVAGVLRALPFERPAAGVVYFKTPFRFAMK
jgi:hypothetical protein